MRTVRDRVIGARRNPDPWLTPSLAGDRRWIRRVACRMPAAFRESQRRRVGVELANLSTHGCAVRGAAPQQVGARCWIILPTLESWSAKVAWCDDAMIGLDFVQPLHRAVAEMIIDRVTRRR